MSTADCPENPYIKEQIADVLTKPLAMVKFEYFREKLGVPQIEVPSKGK